MTEEADPKRIDAEPTKELFVDVLTKDIPLSRAILDLVDNSIDGARRVRPQGAYDGLSVRVTVSPTEFRITDNCGGIPPETARRYAFKFGRDPKSPPTPHSVGQFGVGMKRAFFKLGRHFSIESSTETTRFSIDVNVADWLKLPGWQFAFAELDESAVVPAGDIGTRITVSGLHDAVAGEFGLGNFVSQLAIQIRAAHEVSIERGLAISLNGVPVGFEPSRLLQTDEIKPSFKHLVLGEVEPVDVRIAAGLNSSSPLEAGWYVFCNGRLVVRADQTSLTGWGEDEPSIPRYHNQFSRFRGFVFFDCDNAGKLPWNTTKTGVDTDSEMFIAAKQEMLIQMREVLDFINSVKDAEITLEDLLTNASAVGPSAVAAESRFVTPAIPRTIRPSTTTISYSRPTAEVDVAKRLLSVSSNKQVGERTFQYFLSREGDE